VPDFYEAGTRVESSLRFGDVITGFQAVTPVLHKPGTEGAELLIAISRPAYLAVMTPCCSIENKTISLAPLGPIRPGFLMNPHLVEDLTRLNREVPPLHQVPPQALEKMDAVRREKLNVGGDAYIFMDCFIYAPHPLLRPYQLDRKGGAEMISAYMIDFKAIFRVNCDLINRDADAPRGVKILQLTPIARGTLREKLAYYFVRVPDEDKLDQVR
jgi:hypothetical protein